MKKELRKERQLKRKNFLPSLVFTLILWLFLGSLIYFVDPTFTGAIPLFFLLLFFTLVFTLSLILANTRRGVIVSLVIVLFLLLRLVGIGNILNLLLILGLAITFEIYSMRNE